MVLVLVQVVAVAADLSQAQALSAKPHTPSRWVPVALVLQLAITAQLLHLLVQRTAAATVQVKRLLVQVLAVSVVQVVAAAR